MYLLMLYYFLILLYAIPTKVLGLKTSITKLLNGLVTLIYIKDKVNVYEVIHPNNAKLMLYLLLWLIVIQSTTQLTLYIHY